MCRFFESIRVVNGRFCHPRYHQERINRVFHHFFPTVEPLDLDKINPESPHDNRRYKARVLYRETLEKLEMLPYTPKTIQKVRLIPADALDYSHKFLDRSGLQSLIKPFPEFDEWIFVRNGYLSDASISNIALFDGSGWYTPETPLLPGTCRARLIAEGILKTGPIGIGDLSRFEYISFINALVDLDEITIPVCKVYPMD